VRNGDLFATSRPAAVPRSTPREEARVGRCIAPLERHRIILDGFGVAGPASTLSVLHEPYLEHLNARTALPVETSPTRYPPIPSLLACQTRSSCRLVDEWYISMVPVSNARRPLADPARRTEGELEPALPRCKCEIVRQIPGSGFATTASSTG